MTILIYFIWLVLGVGLAFFVLKLQQWSVGLIDPRKPKLSKLLIIGGAIFRWLFLFVILLIALLYSLNAMLVLFISFLIGRILFLGLWNQTIFSKHKLYRLNKKEG